MARQVIYHYVFDLGQADGVLQDDLNKIYIWVHVGEIKVLTFFQDLVINEEYVAPDAFLFVIDKIVGGAKVTRATDPFRKFLQMS